MSDFLKGNFSTQKKVTEDAPATEAEDLQARYKKNALASVGGSMVYVEKTALEWDGDDD